jgi:methylenetetrahydrofolate dehydrogenase (NADP+)/methenyltetrahydrofolate cyclohydrolase
MALDQPLILNGKPVADAVLERVRAESAELTRDRGIVPGLAVVLVGEDPASATYVRSKARMCERLGWKSVVDRRVAETTESELLDLIAQLNGDETIHGILVQSPLPKHVDFDIVVNTIDPGKDVDGFHPINVGRMVIGLPAPESCTPAGILEMLLYYDIETSGRRVVVVGRSNIVGKPVANMMLQKRRGGNAIVTVAHTGASDIGAVTREAEILIVAAGRAEMITADMVADGAVVIDVGINRIDDPSTEKRYRLVGDVAFAEVAPKCRAITPVPGGVGLMTIAMLMNNTLRSARGDFG